MATLIFIWKAEAKPMKFLTDYKTQIEGDDFQL